MRRNFRRLFSLQGQGDNVFVEYTPSDSATSFCPLVPLGVVNSQAPYDGYSNASKRGYCRVYAPFPSRE
jgi:hypothetical protein